MEWIQTVTMQMQASICNTTTRASRHRPRIVQTKTREPIIPWVSQSATSVQSNQSRTTRSQHRLVDERAGWNRTKDGFVRKDCSFHIGVHPLPRWQARQTKIPPRVQGYVRFPKHSPSILHATRCRSHEDVSSRIHGRTRHSDVSRHRAVLVGLVPSPSMHSLFPRVFEPSLQVPLFRRQHRRPPSRRCGPFPRAPQTCESTVVTADGPFRMLRRMDLLFVRQIPEPCHRTWVDAFSTMWIACSYVDVGEPPAPNRRPTRPWHHDPATALSMGTSPLVPSLVYVFPRASASATSSTTTPTSSSLLVSLIASCPVSFSFVRNSTQKSRKCLFLWLRTCAHFARSDVRANAATSCASSFLLVAKHVDVPDVRGKMPGTRTWTAVWMAACLWWRHVHAKGTQPRDYLREVCRESMPRDVQGSKCDAMDAERS